MKIFSPPHTPPSQALNLSCLTQPLLDPTTWGCTASGSCTTCPNPRPGARPQAAEALGSFSGRGCPFLPVGTDGEARMQRQGHRSPEEVKVSLNPPISDRTGHRGGPVSIPDKDKCPCLEGPKVVPPASGKTVIQGGRGPLAPCSGSPRSGGPSQPHSPDFGAGLKSQAS